LPVDIYQRFQQMAKAIQRPLEDIVFHTCPAKSETIRGNLPNPPSVPFGGRFLEWANNLMLLSLRFFCRPSWIG
jgi:hypothetical protein